MTTKANLRVITLIILSVSTFSASAFAGTYSGGSGTEADSYLISTAADMNEIGANPDDWDDCFVMVNDINLAEFTGTAFNIIGPNSTTPFTGVFDGNDFTISNFTYESNNINCIGLFGFVDDANAELKDLRMLDPNVKAGTGSGVGSLVGYLKDAVITRCRSEYSSVSGERFVGGLAGANNGGTITNCYVSGTVSAESEAGGLVGWCLEGALILNCHTDGNVSAGEFPSGNGDAGGIAGDIRDSTISDCSSSADVSSEVVAGGLVGTNWSSNIFRCYATGTISGTDWPAGGLVGFNNQSSVISDSYATGDVSVPQGGAAGGLVGDHGNGSVLSRCYATGNASGKNYVGGLVGYHHNSFYADCFWDNTVNPDVNGIGNTTDPNVIAKSTAEMQTESTFTGWDFVGESVNGPNDVWAIHESQDYPKLVWKLVNFVGGYEVDFVDFAYFANYWQNQGCGSSNDCDGTDIDFSDAVDANDLKIFCNYWLEGVEP